MSFAEQNRKLAAQVRDLRSKLEPLENVTEFAKGKPCQFRLPGCDGGGDTSVWCHVRRGGIAGVGQKPPDICGGIGCKNCHDKIDSRAQWAHLPEDEMIHKDTLILEGMLRSIAMLWREAGL